MSDIAVVHCIDQCMKHTSFMLYELVTYTVPYACEQNFEKNKLINKELLERKKGICIEKSKIGSSPTDTCVL